MTVTGEYFQPVRLHYRVFNQQGLSRAFKKLRCVEYDPPQNRWVWLYEQEARKLGFKRPYAGIPRHLHPIVIGSFFPRTNDQLLLDLRSFDRARFAIPFFDKHVARSLAKVTEAEIVNKLFSATENSGLTPGAIFDHQTSTCLDPTSTLKRLIEQTAHVQDPLQKLRIAMEEVKSRANKPLPEIERFPVHFYEEGIKGFAGALQVRQVLALQHWLGNTEYSMLDVIHSI